jgi:serine phosphatase RsbU (regulator of sigma subunit)
VLREVGVKSGLAVPIMAAGTTIGSMAVGYADDGAGRRDNFALVGLASRAGIALDNARRYRQQLDVAETLTAALLPSRLPDIPTLSLAARYIPASGGVCGDWYEAERLADGTALLGIGDASGHGLAAASTMAELRNGARSLAIAGMSPAAILCCLSKLMDRSASKIATAIYARIHPCTGTGVWASAGHPPPLVLTAGGEVDFLENKGLALGVVDDPRYVDVPIALASGTTLVMVSDGVIERRGADLDHGLCALRQAVKRLANCDPEEMADQLVEEFCGQPLDDCCVLIARYNG